MKSLVCIATLVASVFVSIPGQQVHAQDASSLGRFRSSSFERFIAIAEQCFEVTRFYAPGGRPSFYYPRPGVEALLPGVPGANDELVPQAGSYIRVDPRAVRCRFNGDQDEPEIVIPSTWRFVRSDGVAVELFQEDRFSYDEATGTWGIQVFFVDEDGIAFEGAASLTGTVTREDCLIGDVLCRGLRFRFFVPLTPPDLDPEVADEICRGFYAQVGLTPPSVPLVGCGVNFNQISTSPFPGDDDFALVRTVPPGTGRDYRVPRSELFTEFELVSFGADGSVFTDVSIPAVRDFTNDRDEIQE